MNKHLRTSLAVRLAVSALVGVLSAVGVSAAAGGPSVVSADRQWCC